ncbi:MAG: lipid IV(A) 3-deoxy-D-manno-octulosonic acid transferase [Methylomonas sp.]|jgi:3-deoxy-D-manno-octulosonic-acid transferase
MRRLYTLLFYALLPVVLLRLYWRGFKAPAYRQRWRERLGYYRQAPARGVVWLHAVSVGEAEAAFPLVRLLKERHPEQPFLVTTTTPTGSARVSQVLGGIVEHVYLPYDVPTVIGRFLNHFRPVAAVILEKEVWPNLYAACAERRIPVFIINARLSARSARNYRKIPSLVKPALAAVTKIAAQTDADKRHFMQIGARAGQVEVAGNIKFDVAIAADVIAAGRALRQKLFAGRFVWIIASSHQGEEVAICGLYPRLKARIPNLLLLIAPRHPERFQTVQKLCAERGLAAAMRSGQGETALSAATDVYIADSMGELKMLYAAADIAFVAGSLAPVGGHNVLEPAAAGIPVLFGPFMFNFQDIAQGMLAADAARQCQDVDAIAEAVLDLYEDAGVRLAMAANAQTFVRQNQGVTARIAGMLEDSFRSG